MKTSWAELYQAQNQVLLVGSNVASMPNFSFLEGVILTIPGVGWGVGVVGLLRNKTKLQLNLVEVELWLG